MSRPVVFQLDYGNGLSLWCDWHGFLGISQEPLSAAVALHIRDDRGQLTIIRPKAPKSLTRAGARSS
jgi:hypothetical protein